MTRHTRIGLALALPLALAACGGSAPTSSSRIGPAGGQVTSGALTLLVPAGALEAEIEIHVTEAQPRDGAVFRAEIEPRGLPLAAPVVVKVRADDAARLKLVEMENEVEHGLENERHVGAEHGREAEIHHLGTVEMRHQAACAAACGAGFECDDGICKPHGGADAPGAELPGPDGTCSAGLELDDGICKAHGGADAPGGVPPGPGGTCPAGLELDDGICKPHGGADAPGGVPPGPGGTCPAGLELDKSDHICKPHGGSGSSGSGSSGSGSSGSGSGKTGP